MFGYPHNKSDLYEKCCLDTPCQNYFWMCKGPKWILTYVYVYIFVHQFFIQF